MTDIKPGAKIKFMHYGQVLEATVEGTSRDGSIIFLKGRPWIHRSSVVTDG